MNILLIDDDEEDAELFTLALQNVAPAWQCTSAKTCDQGLALIQSGEIKPSHIFLDGMLNGMSSKDCLVTLKASELLKGTRIIMYSGFGHKEVQQQFLDLGADQFVQKPSDFFQLQRELKRVLEV